MVTPQVQLRACALRGDGFKVASVRIEDGRWACMEDSKYKYYFVYGLAANARVVVKTFKIEDYGSEEYAEACAKELYEKLNEKP